MTDELLRPFRDKIRGRSVETPGVPALESSPPVEEAPHDSVLIREVRVGPFVEVARLHPGLVPGLPRVRLTIDLGAGLRGLASPVPGGTRAALLALCPRLREHDCGAGEELRLLLAGTDGTAEPDDEAAPRAAGIDAIQDEGDGLRTAHLIEHVAIELLAGITGVGRCSGLTCAHRGRMDRFDIFLECHDPLAGRAALILATALVRDLCLMRMERLVLHRRCRDLLSFLSSSRTACVVAEDVVSRLGWERDDALQTLGELVRLGYLAAAPSLYVFSSASAKMFRKGTFAVEESHAGA